ncbi:MAG: YbhN family protein [Halobaculum sp.]
MDRDQLRATLLGFGAVVVILAVLIVVNDVDKVIGELQNTDLSTLGLVVGATLGWLLAWGIALRTVLSVLSVEIGVPTAFGVFSGAMFANNVTPFGQAGGEPITALLIATVTDTEYERGLAAIASVDTLNFFPSITLALVGAGYYATITTFSRRLRIATGAVVVLAVLVPAAGYLAWRNRDRLADGAVARLVPLVRRVMGWVPGVSKPDPDAVASRIDHFFDSVERVATDRRGIAVALSASAVGWAFQMGGLWLAFRALGVAVDPLVMLFVVPMGAIAGATPTPGGAGLIEGFLVVLLTLLLPDVSSSTVTAAVILFRASIFWVPIAIGGTVVSYVGVDVFS